MNRLLILLTLALTTLLPTMGEACQLLRRPALDVQGNIIVGATVTITKTANAALATLYTDANCTVTIANPVTTIADGTFSVFVKDGVYTITLTKQGYSFIAITNVNAFEPVLENIYPNSKFATTDISINTGDAATSGAIAAIGSNVGTLVITSPASASLTATIPSTLSVVCQGQGSITISATKTLTINGPFKNLTDHPCLIGSGLYVFGPLAGSDPYGTQGRTSAVTYTASMTIDAALGTIFTIEPTDNVAFAVATITHPAYGRRIRINIRNTTAGAIGAGTFSCCKNGASWTQPATLKNRSVDMEYSAAGVWEEVGRTAADVTN